MAMSNADKLAAAEDARHRLLLGQQAVEVDFGTYKTRFTAANRESLESYIAELKALIAGTPTRGAIGFVM
jgi:hypothetical protein